MKKILFGFFGIMMVIGVVAISARALFSSTATAGGVTFATGNADLRVWDGEDWVSDYSPSDLIFTSMYPGYGGTGADESTSKEFITFYLKNMSTSAVSLSIASKLRDGATEIPAGSWDALKDVVYVAVVLPDWSDGSGWHTLNEWNSTGFSLPGGFLAQNTEREYRFYVRVDSAAGNEISDKSVSDIVYEFVGTQTP